MAIKRIRKRDSSVKPFDRKKIKAALQKALSTTRIRDKKISERLTEQVIKNLEKKFGAGIPNVEQIQDTIEEVLLQEDLIATSKAYMLYREKHRQARVKRKFKGIERKSELTLNALKVLQRRYLQRDDEGNIIETPEQLFKRVARAIAQADKLYKGDVATAEEEFYQMMKKLEFLPNTPTLMNAGTHEELGLAACYVLPIEDSLESIFQSLKYQALIHQGGGGTGFSFSRLRAKGSIVQSSKGVASGPISFMQIYDKTTDVIKQGGRRRGANMAILRADHPDILEFVNLKAKGGFENFNISVGVTDKFMQAVQRNGSYELIEPSTQKAIKKIKAREVWNRIIENSWKSGDPGLIFLDEINRKNQVKKLGEIEATNPCGEQPLLPYESCTLGSINLTRMFEDGKIDWEKLRRTVRRAVHFLDNVIDVNKIPIKEVEEMTKGNRRIGLGVMGWAETLFKLKIKYDSKEALKLAEKVMKTIQSTATEASEALAGKRGSFPNIKYSSWKKKMRNVAVTTIAPTGSISIIAGCSSGIEPLFSVSYIREIMEGTQLLEVNKAFEKTAKERKFHSTKMMDAIASKGSIQKITRIPRDVKNVFRTAQDISPEWHVKMQTAFQKYTDNAVSKTINLPEKAKTKDIEKAYFLAYKLKCKGITAFRYGSKGKQVLYIGKKVRMGAEFAGGCPGQECAH